MNQYEVWYWFDATVLHSETDAFVRTCIIERNLWFSKRGVFFIAFVRRDEGVFGFIWVVMRTRRSSPIGEVL